MEIIIGDPDTDWPAWVQAVGSVAAILVAVSLPRIDRWRSARDYSKAVMSAAYHAHAQIASVWGIGRGLAPGADPAHFIDELMRAAAELRDFPRVGAPWVRAISFMRSLALCAEFTAEIARDRPSDSLARMEGIANYAYCLLILIAREVGREEPPPTRAREGVPDHILAIYDEGPPGLWRRMRGAPESVGTV